MHRNTTLFCTELSKACTTPNTDLQDQSLESLSSVQKLAGIWQADKKTAHYYYSRWEKACQARNNKPKLPSFYLLILQKLNVKFNTKLKALASFHNFLLSAWRKAKLSNQTNSCYSRCHLVDCWEHRTQYLTQQSTGSLALGKFSVLKLLENAYNYVQISTNRQSIGTWVITIFQNK